MIRKTLLSFLFVVSQPALWFLLKANRGISSLSRFVINVRSYISTKTGKRSQITNQLIANHFAAGDLTYPRSREMIDQNIEVPASFSAAVNLRSAYDNNNALPERRISNKTNGPEFAKSLGLKTPKQLFSFLSFSDVPIVENSVIKPQYGFYARGVFIVKTEHEILELNTGRVFTSLQSLKQHISYLLNSKVVKKDLWKVEAFVSDKNGNPPNDIKFYAFYGQIGWVVEIQRFPEAKYHIMNGSGATIKSSRYKESQCFVGNGVNKEDLLLAEKISLEIPSPFIRIDFIRASEGLFFTEFTSRPGVIGRLSRQRDHLYGTYYHQAEARLYTDLINGKAFDKFKPYVTSQHVSSS